MPLIEKGILVEGHDGATLVKKYYVQEKPANPYTVKRERDYKAYLWDKKAKCFVRRKVAPDEKGYMWSMGYNHCVGSYAPEGRKSRFSGSSLNRDKSLRYEKRENLATGAGGSIALAVKIAKRYYKAGEVLPEQLRDYIMRQDIESERRFVDWLSEAPGGDENGISLPIYKLSARSRGKIKDKATAFFRACPGERIFCTLTFVAPVDDGTGVRLLNKYLTILRKEFSNLQYLWVAERQPDTGNIHFHIILNKRIPIRKYNAIWVLQQYRAGLRGKTQFGTPISMAEIEQRHKEQSIHRVFNPVDVKRVRSIAGLSSYLTKYITKQADTFFGCLPWHCSRGVSRLFTKAVVGPSAFSYMMSLSNCKVDKSTGEVFMPRRARPKGKGGCFCVIVYVNKKDAPLRYLREMEQINKWLIKGQAVEGVLDCIGVEEYRKWFCKN